MLSILAGGVAGTLAAAAALAAFIAIGALFPVRLEDPFLIAAVRLALGSGVTAFLYAILAAAGQVSLAIYLVLGLAAFSVLAHRPAVAQAGQTVLAQIRMLAAGKAARTAMIAIIAVYWINAVAPPRDGDVVRYHLAHIRQILADRAWLPFADYHYALPFGWSLNYLPFEKFGVPLASHFLNLGLGIITVTLLYRLLATICSRQLALILCAIAALQPLLLKTATTAHADMYVIFIAMILTALLATRQFTAPVAFALGVAGWLAVQSRYQAIAFGLATVLVILIMFVRGKFDRRHLKWFLAGSTLAWLLAAPFYVFNWVHFHNPFWPLLTEVFNRPPSYADQVVAAYGRSLTGEWTPVTILTGLRDGLVSTYTFPIPLAIFGFLVISFKWRTSLSARLALFLAAFLLVWVLAQPSIYLRFFIYLLPVAWVGLAAIIGSHPAPRIQKVAVVAGGLTAAVLAGASGYYSLDSLAYVATGDLARYHQTTWFYDVFTWIDANTPRDARFLVVLTGEPTYYLDRAYRRADPWFSGVVNWSAVRSSDDLVKLMQREGYDYLLYEYRNWRRFPGGDQMIRAVDGVMARDQLELVRRFDTTLSSSRIERRSHVTPVLLFALPRQTDVALRSQTSCGSCAY